MYNKTTKITMKIIFLLFVLLALFNNTNAQTGVPDISWYTPGASSYNIGNADQLAGLAKLVNGDGVLPVNFQSKTITITANIDLGGENGLYGTQYNNGKGWIPIGYFTIEGKDFENIDINTLTNVVNENDRPFRGSLYGNGKTISGLYINNSDLLTAGLFGFVFNGGSVYNLGVTELNISGGTYAVGGITGILCSSNDIFGGSMANIGSCYVSGNITSTEGIASLISGVGGIAGVAFGLMKEITISKSYSTTTIEGNGTVGGVVGAALSLIESPLGNGFITIENCYSSGNISGNISIGGIVGIISTVPGLNMGSVVVNRCYATGSVSGISYVGGLAGRVEARCTFNNSAALNVIIDATSNAGRVTGSNLGALSNNIAFDGIRDKGGNLFYTTAIGPNAIDGETKTGMQIIADGTLGGRFPSPPWAVANGFLPGFESPVVMPVHLNPYFNLTNAVITLSQNEFSYDGTEKTPDITVVSGSDTLTEGAAYNVEYSNNLYAGNNAKVTITGIGDYWGTKTETFTITRTDISNAEINLIPNTFIFDGNPKTPEIKIVINGNTLPQNANYSFTFENNIYAGTAKVVVNGIVNCTGEVEIEFVINKANPDYTVETDLKAIYGQILNEIKFSDNHWSWINPDSSVGDAGIQTHKATFTPDDTDNYNIIDDVNVIIIVSRAAQTLTAEKIICDIEEESIDLEGHAVSTAGDQSGIITYTLISAGTTAAKINGTILSFSAPGTALISASTAGSYNYLPASVTFNLTVSNVGIFTNISPENSLKVYVQNGALYVTGLVIGETLNIYDRNGKLVFQKVVNIIEEKIELRMQGVYFVKCGEMGIGVFVGR